jgi:hypothetical protein
MSVNHILVPFPETGPFERFVKVCDEPSERRYDNSYGIEIRCPKCRRRCA